MANATGRCGNVDYCSLADARQVVEPFPGMEGVCPECASALLPPAAKPPGILRPALAGIGLICVTGAVLYVGLSNFHSAHAIGMVSAPLPYAAGASSHKAGYAAATVARPIVPAALTQPGGAVSARGSGLTR
jgi:hypothetical protein